MLGQRIPAVNPNAFQRQPLTFHNRHLKETPGGIVLSPSLSHHCHLGSGRCTRDTAHWCQCRHAQFQEKKKKKSNRNKKKGVRNCSPSEKPGQPYRLAQSLAPTFLFLQDGAEWLHSLQCYSLLASALYAATTEGFGQWIWFLKETPRLSRREVGIDMSTDEKEIGVQEESHHSFPVRVGRNVSCLCQRWSGPAGCDC